MSRWCWECPTCEDEQWVDWIKLCPECGTPQPPDAYDGEDS